MAGRSETIRDKNAWIADLQARLAEVTEERDRLKFKVVNWEPWMAGLGRFMMQHKVLRFPDDVVAWKAERDAAIEQHHRDVGMAWRIAEAWKAIASTQGDNEIREECGRYYVDMLAQEQLTIAARLRAEAAERSYDTEMAYTADLEAALACDFCGSPLGHIKHLTEDKREAERRVEKVNSFFLPHDHRLGWGPSHCKACEFERVLTEAQEGEGDD